MLYELLGIFIALFAIILTYFKWKYQFWKRKHIPYFEPTIPFGNIQNWFTANEASGTQVEKLYHEFKKNGAKHAGIYILSLPVYIPVDLDILKNIMTRDFDHFIGRGGYYNEKDDPLSAHLLNITGTKWRNLRAKLTPTFTSGKLKTMFKILVECGEHLEKSLAENSKQEIDIKELLGRFTTDIIGSCAFGLECNSIQETDSPFRKHGKAIFDTSVSRIIKRNICLNFPKIASALRLCSIPKDVSEFLMNVIKDSVEYRQKNNIARKDFLQLLINIRDQEDGQGLTIEEIAAQCFVFFAAGFETSATTMSFALYELSLNQDIQDKVREEIFAVLDKHDGKITYDSVSEMKYMEQVVDETLRLHPPATMLTRKCVKDYKIPGTNMVLEKGRRCLIPIMGIHHDEEYYTDPLKFDPNRFTEENKKTRHPYAYIPFGGGPRICIGSRFGIMQTKVGLLYVLKNYRFTLNSRTKTPMKLSPRTVIASVEGKIWLDAHSLSS